MSITALGQYGGPKTNTFGSGESDDFLMNRIVVINNAFQMGSGYAGASTSAIRVSTLAVVGNNTVIGDKVTAVANISGGDVEVSAINNALYYSTSGTVLREALDMGGNFAAYNPTLSLIPHAASFNNYTPTRYAEAGEPVAINPAIAFPGQNTWKYDSKSKEVKSGDWTAGCVSARYKPGVIAISAGINSDLMSGLGQSVEIGPDGIAVFSKEPSSVFFGRGCRVDFSATEYNSDGELITFSTSVLVDVKVDSSGKRWRVTGMDGGTPHTTGYMLNGVYQPLLATCSAYHVIVDLNTDMKSNALAKRLGFRSTGSLISAKSKLDIAMYNCKAYKYLSISTAPETSEEYRIRLYAPGDIRKDCVQRQKCDWRSSKTAGSGFKNSTVSLRKYMISMPSSVYATFENLRFEQVAYQTGDAISKTAGIVTNDGNPLNIDVVNCVFKNVTYVADIGSGIVANNVIYNSNYGVRSSGAMVIVANNTIIGARSATISVADSESGFYAVNNVNTCITNASCILGNQNCFTLANTCTDASGTDRHGHAIAASSVSDMFVSSSDYRPKPRGILFENKAALTHHVRRAFDDDSKHRFTANPADYVAITPVPAAVLPSLDRLLSVIEYDISNERRTGLTAYCGAMEYAPSKKHFSVGMYQNYTTGMLTPVASAIPDGSSELAQPSFLARVMNNGSAQDLNNWYPGLMITTKTSSGVTVVYQASAKVSDTVWELAPTASGFSSSVNIVSIKCNKYFLSDLSDSIALASMLGTNDAVLDNSDLTINLYGVHVVGRGYNPSTIEIRGINTTAVNPLRIRGGSVITTGSAFRFVGVNGASVDGVAFASHHSDLGISSNTACAVEFENCAEPVFSNNKCDRLKVGAWCTGASLMPIYVNNIFNNCKSAILLQSNTWQMPSVYTATSWMSGGLGAEVEFKSWSPEYDGETIEKMHSANRHLVVIRMVLNNSISIPSVSEATYSNGAWRADITVNSLHTWADVESVLTDDNPYSSLGYRCILNDSGVNFAIRKFGQNTLPAISCTNYGTGYLKARQIVRPGMYVKTLWAHPDFFGPQYASIAAGSSRAFQVTHNTFVKCGLAIDVPHNNDSAWAARATIANNLFFGNNCDISPFHVNNIGFPDNAIFEGEVVTELGAPTFAGNMSSSPSLGVMLQWSEYNRGWHGAQAIIKPSLRLSGGECLEARASALSPHEIDWGTPMHLLYGSSPYSDYPVNDYDSYAYDVSSNPIKHATMCYNMLYALPRFDIDGDIRSSAIATCGARDLAITGIGNANIESGYIEVSDYDINTSFEGYNVVYKLTYSPAAKQFYYDEGVADTALSDGMVVLAGNIQLINDHVNYSKFIKTAKVLVDAAALPYTIGPTSIDAELESRLAADGLISDSGVSMRYVRTESGIPKSQATEEDYGNWPEWFSAHYLPSFQSLKPAFCGCFTLQPLVANFTLSIETNPEQYGNGTAVLVGRGVDSYSMDIYRAATNSHDPRWNNPDGTPMISESDTYSCDKAAIIEVGAYAHNVVIRNIAMTQLDNRPYKESQSLVGVSSLISLSGASTLSIYNSIMGYFGQLLKIDNGAEWGMLNSVTINNNALVQYDMARQKIDELAQYFPDGEYNYVPGWRVITDGAEHMVSPMPMYEIGLNDDTNVIVGVPMRSNGGKFVNYEINNNDVLVYNAGLAQDAESTTFEFIQGLDKDDPDAIRYSPSVVQKGNRMIHGCASQDTATPFIFGPSVSGFDSRMSNTQTTSVHGAVNFGDNSGGNTYITTEFGLLKRMQFIDVDDYFSDTPSYEANQAAMQKFDPLLIEPTVSSSAYSVIGGGYSKSDIWQYTDVSSISASGSAGPKFDIIGNPRFHKNGSIDIGAFYISYLTTSFGRDNIIDIEQVLLDDTGGGIYRIVGGNALFTPVVAATTEDYSVGAKMLIRVRPNTNDVDSIRYKPMDVVAVFDNALFDDSMMCILMPQAGTLNGSPATGYFMDQIFQGLLSNRYILGYDYVLARATIYKNALYRQGCTGDFSPMDQARYSENRMVVA